MSNNVFITGANLTADPELRFTKGGKAFATFSVADNRRWTADGGVKEEVSFFNCTAWGALAENAAASLHKGDRVNVSGRLEQQRWEKDGERHSTIKIVAQEVAPSLAFAEAELTRNSARGSSNGSTPTQSEEREDVRYQEEPF